MLRWQATKKEAEGRAVKRNEIVEEAKQFVLSSGPSNILEFGSEVIQDHNYGQWSTEDAEAILAEAVKQAERVYHFLGYIPRGGFTTR